MASSSSDSNDPNTTALLPDLNLDPLLEPGSFNDPALLAQNNELESDYVSDEPVLATMADEALERPPWLPDDWKMVFNWGSGTTAGSVDQYYLEPKSGGRFRSKNEVEYFLKTGTKRKYSEAASDGQTSESPEGGIIESRPSPPQNFDFDNVPEMTTWKLIDASKDLWWPYVDGKKVEESVKREWDAAFEALASGRM